MNISIQGLSDLQDELTHVIIKLQRDNLKTVRAIRTLTDFSSQTLEISRQWGNIFKVLREK